MLVEEIKHIAATKFRGAYTLRVLWARIPATGCWIVVTAQEVTLGRP